MASHLRPCHPILPNGHGGHSLAKLHRDRNAISGLHNSPLSLDHRTQGKKILACEHYKCHKKAYEACLVFRSVCKYESRLAMSHVRSWENQPRTSANNPHYFQVTATRRKGPSHQPSIAAPEHNLRDSDTASDRRFRPRSRSHSSTAKSHYISYSRAY